MFSGHRASELKAWLAGEAENATTNHGLARRFVDERWFGLSEQFLGVS
jgi:hypothetical protein